MRHLGGVRGDDPGAYQERQREAQSIGVILMLDLLVQSLAIARLLRLLTEEEGPWNVIEKFRTAIGISKYGEYDENRTLAGLFSCHWCLGIWVSPIVFITYKFVPFVIYVLAIAQLGSFMNAITNKVIYD